MQNFLAYINSLTPLSEKATNELVEKMVPKHYVKHSVLVPDLSRCDKFFFVEKGLLRLYYYNKDREITDYFAPENSVFGPVLRNTPIKNFAHAVETLEDSVVLQIPILELELLFLEHPDLERFGRLIALQAIFQLQSRIDSIQFFSAKERYDDFVKSYPDLLQRVPLGHIASYLGMNQVTLSRVRNQRD